MTNFEKWRNSLTPESLTTVCINETGSIYKDDVIVECDSCPAYGECGVTERYRECGCRESFLKWANTPCSSDEDKAIQSKEIIDAAIVVYSGYPYTDRRHFLDGLLSLLESTLQITTEAEFLELLRKETEGISI
jgi:hypothetical protein